ncbi:glycine receptor subunit alpha-2-like [Amphibalanus amphitrite]|nr:glycine receptor subunit alpha-2-like [Amphibalanus amphitrite]
MVLVITTLLTLTALFSANVQGMPEVSYVKAIDVWTLACIVFVFGTILEYIVVLRLSTHNNTATVAPKEQNKAKTLKGNWTMTGAEKADRLERFSRVASVVAFAIFNIAYWAYYLG